MTEQPSKTDEEIIKSGDWADCGICKRAFRRRRQTARYCSVCKQGFCEGEHGNFAQNRGLCVICGEKKKP